MTFPQCISFTLTNACNLRCRMCGQWSAEGYVRGGQKKTPPELVLADWKRLVDEAAAHQVGSILLRGGEPFLFPGIVELLEHIHDRGLFVAIDTNGTQLKKFAADIVRIGRMHLTISVDGPEEIHDAVRGVTGCFKQIREGVAALNELEKDRQEKTSKSICFVISPYSLKGLGSMPDVARSLSINTIAIVPYYFVPESVGNEYTRVLSTELGCPAFSMRGFHHEQSGVDFDEFRTALAQYRNRLDGLQDYPYLPLSEDEYRTWFGDATTPVGSLQCMNVERLIDIQPGGDANFCVDFPDYVIGNVRESTIEAVWNSERAERFRQFRRQTPLPVCHRCGAKHMSGG